MRHPFRTMVTLAMVAATAGCAVYVGPHPGVVYVNVAPPPLRAEIIVGRPGPSVIWRPGRWAWRVRDYVWVPGAWVAIEPGFHEWIPGRWGHDHHGWYWIEGRWR